ncbi:A kinase (PRKA) anchor protein 1b [Polypterus senegalus]|uniref:A kinase (PRKA) anchor protein 1b n=1 Tax=Polypterus senegalus TaxID=55291 RepID=UPI001962A129|nr:A kinase (PRKA) anchor protein 1b [Polypterus senegalus]XP_039612606.1 A kinase (PRKA) anchor protein 1b [Polypterus senegalus]
MALRFRSFFPYTLPGVLALIGWWWYISRKKGRISNSDKEVGSSVATVLGAESANGNFEVGSYSQLASTNFPTEGSHHHKSLHENQINTPEQLAEDCSGKALIANARPSVSGGLPCCSTNTLELAADKILDVNDYCTSSLIQEHTVPMQEASVNPEAVKSETCSVSEEAFQLVNSKLDETSIQDAISGNVCEGNTEKVEVIMATAAACTMLEIVESKIVSPTAHLTEAIRPEPEGEVADDKVSVSFAEKVQIGTYDVESNLTTEEKSASSSDIQLQKLGVWEPHDVIEASSLLPLQEAVRSSIPVENGMPHSTEIGEKTEDLEKLASGIILQVISAAMQDLVTVRHCDEEKCCVPGDPIPSTILESNESNAVHDCSNESLIARDQITESCQNKEEFTDIQDSTQTSTPQVKREKSHQDQFDNSFVEESTSQTCKSVNGTLLPSKWDTSEEGTILSPPKSHHGALMGKKLLQAPRSVIEVFADHTEDSGCSTCQSEDGMSNEDQLIRTGVACVLQEQLAGPSDMTLIEGSLGQEKTMDLDRSATTVMHEMDDEQFTNGGLNGSAANLKNGIHWSPEAEADHSGGSDVNSMDSVDSGCTLGAGENNQSKNPSSSLPKSELSIWEIEVPKHLVGRLIGKQGRYVSFLKQSSGAKIYISTLPYTQDYQICHIEGSQQQVDKALGLIGKKFKELDLTNLYAPPPLPLTLPSLPITSWLLLPDGVTVEVIVVNIITAGHMFVQQHTHPTYHALRSLDQQMFLCYSQPGIPTLPSPVEVGVICAAPAGEGAWWRAQVISFYKDTNEVEIRYVDYGGYERVKISVLRQIRSDFVTLPFQGAEVLLDNLIPIPGEDRFPPEADAALEELTRGVALLAQVSNYDSNTGLPQIQLWNMVGDELVSINRTLVERGFASWVDNF